MDNVIFFNSLQDAKAFQQDLKIKQTNNASQVLTKKEIKLETEQNEQNIKTFFINLKDDFISKEKNAPTRKKLIKRLKKFIENSYKNSGMQF